MHKYGIIHKYIFVPMLLILYWKDRLDHSYQLMYHIDEVIQEKERSQHECTKQ